jgi:hypothetical protein
MRIIALLLLGFVIGAMATVITLNALRQGTAFLQGVMAVKGYHMARLRDAVVIEPCQPDRIAHHLRALRVLADDIEPAFLPDGMTDPIFSRYAMQMGERVDALLAALPAADCPALRGSLGDIGDGCKACHRDYKP